MDYVVFSEAGLFYKEYTSLVYFVGPKILYEQEHNAEQLLVKNFSVKVRPKIVAMTTLGSLISSLRVHD